MLHVPPKGENTGVRRNKSRSREFVKFCIDGRREKKRGGELEENPFQLTPHKSKVFFFLLPTKGYFFQTEEEVITKAV